MFPTLEYFLNEKLITFGGKAYPKYGNVVFLAGGAGSGKGFIKDNLIGIEGRVIDPDGVKLLAVKSEKINNRVKQEYGIDLSKGDFRNPDFVNDLHVILQSELKLSDRRDSLLYTSIFTQPKETKPNLIFDYTIANLKKLWGTTSALIRIGYEPENIHLVWVVNDINVAIQQNQERSRRVPDVVLSDTHFGASNSLNTILRTGDQIRELLDGDIWIAFNSKTNLDVEIEKSDLGGSYVVNADYVKVKSAGKSLPEYSEISQRVLDKIRKYVPNSYIW